jgi:mannose-6-phosphate isomerase-like protein (cupin superfamily)
MQRRAEGITDLPRFMVIEGHHAPAPFYLTHDMFGGMPVEVAALEISGLLDSPIAELHTHPHDEIYLLLSPEPGAAEIAITAGGEDFSLTSPGAFVVPAGMLHRFTTVRAQPGSFLIGVLREPPADPDEA